MPRHCQLPLATIGARSHLREIRCARRVARTHSRATKIITRVPEPKTGNTNFRYSLLHQRIHGSPRISTLDSRFIFNFLQIIGEK